MHVRVCGPNLSGNAQQKGDLHVHASCCNDLNYYGPGRRYGGDVRGPEEMLVKNATIKGVVEACYSDHIAESETDTWESYISSFWFAPCCSEGPYAMPYENDHQSSEVVNRGLSKEVEEFLLGPDATITVDGQLHLLDHKVYECWVVGERDSFVKFSDPTSPDGCRRDVTEWVTKQLEGAKHRVISVVKHDALEYSNSHQLTELENIMADEG